MDNFKQIAVDCQSNSRRKRYVIVTFGCAANILTISSPVYPVAPTTATLSIASPYVYGSAGAIDDILRDHYRLSDVWIILNKSRSIVNQILDGKDTLP